MNSDDPRLTTYALNEHQALSAEDIKEIEAALREQPALQERVTAIQSEATRLQDMFAAQPEQSLTEQQRQQIQRDTRASHHSWFGIAAVASAAALTIAVLTPLVFTAQSSRDERPIHVSTIGHDAGDKSGDQNSGIVPPTSTAQDIEAEPDRFQGHAEVMDIEPADPNMAGDADKTTAKVEAKPKAVAESESGGAQAFLAIGAGANKNRRFRMRKSEIPIDPAPIQSDNYNSIHENAFRDMRIKGNDFSTFSIDVDTASYSDMRSHLTQYHRLPQARAIRVEEFINYFDYQYPGPKADAAHPFRYHVESAICPWNSKHRLLRIGIQGKRIVKADRPPCNLVFLLDVSGSMRSGNKLPLLKQAFRLLVEQLDERDQVAIVTYAGASGLVLKPSKGSEKAVILDALQRLRSGGSTNGAGGIQQAYQVAAQMQQDGEETRVILATDGDFNVGTSDQTALVNLLKEKAKSGVFLNIHGYGMSNRKDGRMEQMANNGNGTYAYIDTIREAQKVMVDDLTGSLVTIAKDVKIQCVFNPQHVAGWRLIGYENRTLKKEDFKNDKVDAGEIGAGHNVTALYEIVPSGSSLPSGDVDPSPFVKEQEQQPPELNDSPAWLQLRLRYKQPQGSSSIPLVQDVIIDDQELSESSESFRWAAGVAAFGMRLRQSQHSGDFSWQQIIELARASRGPDANGLRAECIKLMEIAESMQP